jgi:predicted CXXCH cytochrome family protein
VKKFLRESEHLVRLALLAAVLVVAFLVIRWAVVPAGFGRYGHYRAPSLDDVRARPISFAGHQACETCHDEQAKTKGQGKHAQVSCEACHGPLAAHADDPFANKAVKPNPATLCVRCHEADSAKPKSFPQVVSSDHAGGESCGTCHNPHSPAM